MDEAGDQPRTDETLAGIIERGMSRGADVKLRGLGKEKLILPVRVREALLTYTATKIGFCFDGDGC